MQCDNLLSRTSKEGGRPAPCSGACQKVQWCARHGEGELLWPQNQGY